MVHLLMSPIFLLVLLTRIHAEDYDCESLEIVESIPDNLTFNTPIMHKTTTEGLLELLDLAEQKVDIAEFYFSLRAEKLPGDGSESDGLAIYNGILKKSLELEKQGGSVRLVVNTPSEAFPDDDAISLAKHGHVSLKWIDFETLIGGGILHTKLWIVDEKHFYLGSANMDWLSFRQVKELGILGKNCGKIAKDLQSIFKVYWYLTGKPVPSSYPSDFQTFYNITNKMEVSLKDGYKVSTFIVSSPPPLCPHTRTVGIEGLLYVLQSAKKFINIEVMEYFPAIIFSPVETYWPVIDDALRSAVFTRGVDLRLLTSPMAHNKTRKDEFHYLQSLAALNGSRFDGKAISLLRLFILPSFTPQQSKLLFARVNHAKFVVTDKHVYLSTSNWAGNYFTVTGGISMIIENNESCAICKDLASVFQRDWYSKYAHHVDSNTAHDDIEAMIQKSSSHFQNY